MASPCDLIPVGSQILDLSTPPLLSVVEMVLAAIRDCSFLHNLCPSFGNGRIRGVCAVFSFHLAFGLALTAGMYLKFGLCPYSSMSTKEFEAFFCSCSFIN